MDARLDTLITELYQLNTCVNHIARWQAHLSGFVESPSPSLKAYEDEHDDDGFGSDDDDEDEDACSVDDDEMIAWVTYPLSFVTKKGSSFGYKSSHVLRGRGSIGDIFVREVFLFMRDVVRTYVFFFFFLLF